MKMESKLLSKKRNNFLSHDKKYLSVTATRHVIMCYFLPGVYTNSTCGSGSARLRAARICNA